MDKVSAKSSFITHALDVLYRVEALYDFTPQTAGQVSLTEGRQYSVYGETEGLWFKPFIPSDSSALCHVLLPFTPISAVRKAGVFHFLTVSQVPTSGFW